MVVELQETKISKAVSLVLKLASKKKSDDVLSDEYLPVQIQIGVKKIPKEQKYLKLKLPHPISKPGDDVCLFVKDVDKKERDTEPTITFYENLLSKKGVKNIKEIIPVKGLKTDYKPYEAKWNLSNAYDVYLADERIVTCLPRLLGKSFYGRKRVPTQVNLLAKDLTGEIDKAVNASKFAFSNKGSTSMALIGHCGMNQDHITANVMAAIDQISSFIPGTSDNIKQLSIKARSCTSIPIYISEGGPQDVKIKPKKKSKPKVEIDELSTIPDAKVAIYPDGKVLVIKEGQTLKQVADQDRRSNTKKRKRQVKKEDNLSSKKAKKTIGAKTKQTERKIPKATVIRKLKK